MVCWCILVCLIVLRLVLTCPPEIDRALVITTVIVGAMEEGTSGDRKNVHQLLSEGDLQFL